MFMLLMKTFCPTRIFAWLELKLASLAESPKLQNLSFVLKINYSDNLGFHSCNSLIAQQLIPVMTPGAL